MSNDDLHDLIARLKSEITALDANDRDTRQRLRSLVEDLERRIAEDEDAPEHEDLMESLRDSVERFEVAHPRATGILNDIMVMLGNMGI